jgi:ArsR family transcriptional regulator, arsenate/arsenite/antimonite-responsive transcriptional repressor
LWRLAGRTPIRVKMLGVLAEGRWCCELPDCGVPARDQDAGICVCEFERQFDAGQSKVSYYLGKLEETGLVHEERRGKWSFCSLDRGPSGWLTGAQDTCPVSVHP